MLEVFQSFCSYKSFFAYSFSHKSEYFSSGGVLERQLGEGVHIKEAVSYIHGAREPPFPSGHVCL